MFEALFWVDYLKLFVMFSCCVCVMSYKKTNYAPICLPISSAHMHVHTTLHTLHTTHAHTHTTQGARDPTEDGTLQER